VKVDPHGRKVVIDPTFLRQLADAEWAIASCAENGPEVALTANIRSKAFRRLADEIEARHD
jgi:hypothetical protein